MKKQVIYFLFNIFKIFRIDNKKIVVSSYYGNSCEDSPKYIVKEILNKNKKYKIIWLVNETNTVEKFKLVKYIKYGSLLSIYHLATAKYWIDNVRKSDKILKRNDQIYIQTWHGAPAIKKIEKDAEEILDSNYIKRAKEDSKKNRFSNIKFQKNY